MPRRTDRVKIRAHVYLYSGQKEELLKYFPRGVSEALRVIIDKVLHNLNNSPAAKKIELDIEETRRQIEEEF